MVGKAPWDRQSHSKGEKKEGKKGSQVSKETKTQQGEFHLRFFTIYLCKFLNELCKRRRLLDGDTKQSYRGKWRMEVNLLRKWGEKKLATTCRTSCSDVYHPLPSCLVKASHCALSHKPFKQRRLYTLRWTWGSGLANRLAPSSGHSDYLQNRAGFSQSQRDAIWNLGRPTWGGGRGKQDLLQVKLELQLACI